MINRIVCGTWIYVLMLVLSMTYFSIYSKPPCTFSNYLHSVAYYIIIFHFFGLSILTTILYAKVAYVAYSRFKGNSIAPSKSDSDTSKLRQQTKITQVMGLVLGVYFCLYIPNIIASLLMPKWPSLWYECIYCMFLLM